MVELINEMMYKYLKKLLVKIKKKFNIKKVILFGSRAKGNYFLDSDVDILLVSPDFEGIFFSDRMGDIIYEWDGPVDLEPFCYTQEEFEKKKKQIGIVKEAIKTGIEIK